MGGSSEAADEDACQATCKNENCKYYFYSASEATNCKWLTNNDKTVMQNALKAETAYSCHKNLKFIPPARASEYIWATCGVIFGIVALASICFFGRRKRAESEALQEAGINGDNEGG